MGALVAGMKARDHQPFLHVITSNSGAIRVYQALGFATRRTATISVVSPQ
jgi:predicted GNAT family acetyltransferase